MRRQRLIVGVFFNELVLNVIIEILQVPVRAGIKLSTEAPALLQRLA